jgi:hypothetical protein
MYSCIWMHATSVLNFNSIKYFILCTTQERKTIDQKKVHNTIFWAHELSFSRKSKLMFRRIDRNGTVNYENCHV